MLPESTRPQELLLLQDPFEGRIHCGESFHARQVCCQRLPRSSSGGGNPDESQLDQSLRQKMIPLYMMSSRFR